MQMLWTAALLLATAQEADVMPKEVRSAVRRALPLIQKSAAVFPQERACFSCHHQALPVLAMTAARDAGFEVDAKVYERQLEHTAAWLKKGIPRYRDGRGQGGRAMTAGYALWTLDLGARKPDEVTGIVAEYLLGNQKDRASWRPQSQRPPSEASTFATTAFAIRALQVFGPEDRAAQRIGKARRWLEDSAPKDTEDLVFRLQGLDYADADGKSVEAAVRQLREAQRNDGGWAQTPEMKSDAYATGTALVVLRQAGGAGKDDPAVRRGLAYLVRTQEKDVTWHVKTRSKPIQKYFESGFPHGKDQFISIAASCWATTALALALDSE